MSTKTLDHSDYALPHNEIERLETLEKSGMLDPKSQNEFEAVVGAVKKLLDVPVVLISMVGQNEQFFKAKIGVEATCTPRNVSFCTHAILKHETMVVLDATQDARFAENPMVTSAPNIRFYAGAPIIVPDGLVLGTLCLIDIKPHAEFSAEDKQTLESFALITAKLVELNLLNTA